MESSEPAPIGCSAIKPIERHGFEALSWFLYDRNTGAVMGRTPLSWLKITVFYIIYYIFLAFFWYCMISVFMTTVNEDAPKWQQEESLIGRSPALGVRPKQEDRLIHSGIIQYRKDLETSKEGEVPGFGGWSNRTRNFVLPYTKTHQNQVDCLNGGKLNKKGQFCGFPLSQLGDCRPPNYGYDQGKPCVILKLNRIFGLVPEYYNNTDDLPTGFPKALRQRIDKLAKSKDRNKVWMECQGENPGDTEAMGDISYYPEDQGFSSEYFPYLNQPNYQSPLVAIQFHGPTVGRLLHIECRAWAANIHYSRRDMLGRAHFELLIHDATTANAVNTGCGQKGRPAC